jgi:hypothetical protein
LNGSASDIGNIRAELDMGDYPSFGTFTARVWDQHGETDQRAFTSTPFDWHQIEIDADHNGVTFLLDGTSFFTFSGDYRFDTVYMQQWLAGSAALAAFDDFRSDTTSTPEPGTLGCLAGGLALIALAWRKV